MDDSADDGGGPERPNVDESDDEPSVDGDPGKDAVEASDGDPEEDAVEASDGDTDDDRVGSPHQRHHRRHAEGSNGGAGGDEDAGAPSDSGSAEEPDEEETDSVTGKSDEPGESDESAERSGPDENKENAADANETDENKEADDDETTGDEGTDGDDSENLTSTQITDEGSTDAAEAELVDADYEGPESDEEMPLADHIEEMVRRLAIVFGIGGVVTLIAYPASAFLIEFLWQSYIPSPGSTRPHIYGPLEYVLAKLKVAGLSGTVVGLPVFVYQSYRFMKPGLYSKERRYYLASVPTSLVLALVGVVFAHLVILPLTMVYFTSYTADAAVVAFGLQETFNLIIVMMGYMAIVFQIPLFIMLAIMMGLVSRQWMEDKRILFWGAFGGLAFTFVSVDPTGMAPIIIAVTMIVLFEGTLLLLRWTGN
jgi:sec-independent protein translocase protein TatC